LDKAVSNIENILVNLAVAGRIAVGVVLRSDAIAADQLVVSIVLVITGRGGR